MAFKTRRAALATVLFVVAFALAVFGGRAQAAQTTLTVSPLTIGFGGTVNGTISGFAANAAVTVNGRVYTSDNSGVVSLGGAQLLTTGPA